MIDVVTKLKLHKHIVITYMLLMVNCLVGCYWLFGFQLFCLERWVYNKGCCVSVGREGEVWRSVYGTTNADAGVGIGMKKGDSKN